MKIAVFSQVVNGAVLPFVLIFMLLLINKKELMGEYVNKPTFNIIAWATTVIMIGLTVLLCVRTGARRHGIDSKAFNRRARREIQKKITLFSAYSAISAVKCLGAYRIFPAARSFTSPKSASRKSSSSSSCRVTQRISRKIRFSISPW